MSLQFLYSQHAHYGFLSSALGLTGDLRQLRVEPSARRHHRVVRLPQLQARQLYRADWSDSLSRECKFRRPNAHTHTHKYALRGERVVKRAHTLKKVCSIKDTINTLKTDSFARRAGCNRRIYGNYLDRQCFIINHAR